MGRRRARHQSRPAVLVGAHAHLVRTRSDERTQIGATGGDFTLGTIAEFRRALAIDPALGLAQANYAWALSNQGRLDEAVAQFEQARRRHPESADLEFKWGLAFARRDRAAKALPHFERAVELQPDDANLRHALGRALLAIGRREDARAQFTEGLRLDPNHAGAQEGLALTRHDDATPR